MRQPPGRYSLSMRLLHWTIAALVIANVALALGADLWKEVAGNPFPLHKSIGVTVLVLLALRIVARFTTAVPSYPEEVTRFDRLLAHLNHFGLYLLLAAMPLTGYTMSVAGGRGVQWFGIDLPVLVPQDEDLADWAHDMHETLAWVLLAMIALHLAGVAKHLVIDRSNILKRMV